MDPREAHEALNIRGSFLKKRVLQEIYDNIPGLSIFDEEIGMSYGQSRAADIICFHSTSAGNVFYVLECKRVAPGPEWLFLRHIAPNYRELRLVARGGLIGGLVEVPANSHLVCSEGYETTGGDAAGRTLVDDPVLQAANQLSGAYLGFVKWVKEKRIKARMAFVPVLVTTTPLQIADFSWDKVELSSGLLMEPLKVRKVDWLVLKHPFPKPAGEAEDFRLEDEPLMSTQAIAESVYVVQAGALKSFFSSKRMKRFGELLGS
ncbi:MAG TPA: hypothetical protein VGM54_12965 [Chthoniobacter sp.]|jgi:hypothetical protein